MKPNAQEEARIAAKAKEAVDNALRSILGMGKPTLSSQTMSAGMKARRCAYLKTQVKNLLATTKDTGRQTRLLKTLERLERIEAKVKTQALHQNTHTECIMLEERAYKPFRRLTSQEVRVDFAALNDEFNEIGTSLEDELSVATREELERALANAKNKLDAGDIAGLAAIVFLFRQRVDEIITRTVKASYDVGRDGAAQEIGVDRPPTPLLDKQLMNVDAADIAEGYATNLENTLSSAIKAGVAAGAASAAIIAAARETVVKEAAKEITNISGTLVGQYVNMGRNNVIFKNIDKVVAMQRSEVLDGRTCALCISLDERVVSPSDPMANLQIVHTHCRGTWVPILTTDEEQPAITGIPKSIQDTFETIDGRPIVNGFKQLKKPINDVSKSAMDEIKRRLEAKKS